MITLPSLPPIDRTRKGSLDINPIVLAGLLGLPPTLEIYSASFSPAAGVLRLQLDGEPMPKLDRHAPPRPVSLVIYETRTDAGTAIHAEWNFAPGKKWLVTFRPAERPTATPLEEGHYWVRYRHQSKNAKPVVAAFRHRTGWLEPGRAASVPADQVIVCSGRLPEPEIPTL